ncbi:acyl carrier protein [Streptomyces sp. Wb2n-11]|uniref:acyl carrier protein n=1 Tax=Streptomyces sp. Wb2n-11 TaxID=1030533 RepID=UPI000AC05C44|nr:phosphopantetheine-binding protein [Streptomyces sp. Wb2n-11]
MTTPTGARERMAEVVREVVGQILPDVAPHDITGDRHLKDLGADSVDRVEIILGIMDRLGLEESMSSFGELPDIDALIDFLAAAGGR